MAQAAKLDRLLARPPSFGEILRRSLLQRTTFHSQGCSKCASGQGHRQWVLNVNYPAAKGDLRTNSPCARHPRRAAPAKRAAIEVRGVHSYRALITSTPT